jgi:hypothetical protein
MTGSLLRAREDEARDDSRAEEAVSSFLLLFLPPLRRPYTPNTSISHTRSYSASRTTSLTFHPLHPRGSISVSTQIKAARAAQIQAPLPRLPPKPRPQPSTRATDYARLRRPRWTPPLQSLGPQRGSAPHRLIRFRAAGCGKLQRSVNRFLSRCLRDGVMS